MRVAGVLGRSLLGGALVLCLGASTGAAPDRGSGAHPAPRGPAAATTTHENVVATRRYATWLLHAVPMPPGSRELSHSPTPYLQGPSTLPSGSDPGSRRTTWWTLDLATGELDAWLRSHAPSGLRPASMSVWSNGVAEHDQEFTSPSTMGRTTGTVRFASTSGGAGLVVRVDTFLSPRVARTLWVPRDSTSVTIRRTERSLQIHPRSRARTTVATVAAPGEVGHLVALVDDLPGQSTTSVVHGCPLISTDVDYSMTFTGPDGTRVVSERLAGCASVVRLTRDDGGSGDLLELILGRRFEETMDAHLPPRPPQRISPAPA